MSRIKLGMLVSCCVAVATFMYVRECKNQVSISLERLDNVEALASGESGGVLFCYGTGCVDCYGEKVKYTMTPR